MSSFFKFMSLIFVLSSLATPVSAKLSDTDLEQELQNPNSQAFQTANKKEFDRCIDKGGEYGRCWDKYMATRTDPSDAVKTADYRAFKLCISKGYSEASCAPYKALPAHKLTAVEAEVLKIALNAEFRSNGTADTRKKEIGRDLKLLNAEFPYPQAAASQVSTDGFR